MRRAAWRALLTKTLLIFGRNAPVVGALALGVRLGQRPLSDRALLVGGGAILSAWLISVTEQYLDALVFSLSGGLVCWYLPHGGYGTDGAVGVGLAAVIVVVQYGVLGDAFFFDRLRAAVAYFGALAIIVPLMGLRASLGLPTTTAPLVTLGLTLALSPVLAYLNYTLGADSATAG